MRPSRAVQRVRLCARTAQPSQVRRQANGLVGEVVAEHILGIDPFHPRRSLLVPATLCAEPLLVPCGPLVEGVPIHEEIPQRLVPILRRLFEVAEGTEDIRIIGDAPPHQFQQTGEQ